MTTTRSWDEDGELDAWQRRRNANGARIDWLFTLEKARLKMKRAYPHVAASRNGVPETAAA